MSQGKVVKVFIPEEYINKNEKGYREGKVHLCCIG